MPALRAGRLVRRSSWKKGVCLGGWTTKQGHKVEHLSQYSRYDKDSGGGTWAYPSVDSDLLADDWEVVPEAVPWDGVRHDFKDALTELALLIAKTQNLDEGSDDQLYRSMLHEAIEVGKTKDIERLLGALAFGIAVVAKWQWAKKNETR